ncbi:MAG TPA: pyridoxal-phosphate dependent enzyme [Leucothrix sp.]|nr:pyridoxal-phosphate dependent enzyme [Leucothrix sp.]
MQLTIEKKSYPVADFLGIKLYMARIDKIHPLASGNKYYKLKPNLEYAKKQGITRLLSFGGAFSNHIHALALYAHQQGFETVGIIRGEPEYAKNPTLVDVQRVGMTLTFVNRQEYRRRHDKVYLARLQEKHPDTLIIPEGGSSQLAVGSCSQLMHDINKVQEFDYVVAACGTGATFAGLVCGLSQNQIAIAYSALLDDSLNERIDKYIANEGKTNINYKIESAAFGGFAKLSKEVLDFVLDWLDKTNVLLDPIYTSKMTLRLMQQIKSGEFPEGTSICIVHSGGLQGWRGMERQVIKLSGSKSWAIISKKLRALNSATDCQNA